MSYQRIIGAWAANSLARRISLQLLLLIGTLAAAELILLIVDLRELRDGYHVGSPVVFQYEPELGWLPVANIVAPFASLRAITVRNNSFGLRDIEHDQSARPTVMFVGDSFVWGFDVEASERFTELLRDQLPGIRIVNAGVNGYGTDQEYLLRRRIWRVFKPDVVVLMFCVDNDRQDNTTNLRGGYYKPYLTQASDGDWHFAGQPPPKSRNDFIENAVVKNLWLARAAVTGYVYLRHPKLTVPDPTERLIAMMRDFVTTNNAKFLVGLQRHEPGIEAFLRAQEIPYTSFDGAESYAEDWNHWTPAGHALVAARVKSFLDATGALAVPGSTSVISSQQRP